MLALRNAASTSVRRRRLAKRPQHHPQRGGIAQHDRCLQRRRRQHHPPAQHAGRGTGQRIEQMSRPWKAPRRQPARQSMAGGDRPHGAGDEHGERRVYAKQRRQRRMQQPPARQLDAHQQRQRQVGQVVADHAHGQRRHRRCRRHATSPHGVHEQDVAAQPAAGHGLIGEQLGQAQRHQAGNGLALAGAGQHALPYRRCAGVGRRLQHQRRQQPAQAQPAEQGHDLVDLAQVQAHHDHRHQQQQAQQPAGDGKAPGAVCGRSGDRKRGRCSHK